MRKTWTDQGCEDYLYWQTQDKKTLRKINELVRDIERNVEQATTEFGRVVDSVASDRKEVTILRSGRPVVRIDPVRVYRTTEPDPRFAGSISTADLFF